MEPTEAAIGLYREIAETLDSPALGRTQRATGLAPTTTLDDLWRRVEHDLVPGARRPTAGRHRSHPSRRPRGPLLVEARGPLRRRGPARPRPRPPASTPGPSPRGAPAAAKLIIDGAKADPPRPSRSSTPSGRRATATSTATTSMLRRAQRAARPEDGRHRACSTARPGEVGPSLATLNGVGTMLYGQRDARPDNSYVPPRFFVLLHPGAPARRLARAARRRPTRTTSSPRALGELVRTYDASSPAPRSRWPSPRADPVLVRVARAPPALRLRQAAAYARTHPAEAALARTARSRSPTPTPRPPEANAPPGPRRPHRHRPRRASPPRWRSRPRILDRDPRLRQAPLRRGAQGRARRSPPRSPRGEPGTNTGSLAALGLRAVMILALERVSPGDSVALGDGPRAAGGRHRPARRRNDWPDRRARARAPPGRSFDEKRDVAVGRGRARVEPSVPPRGGGFRDGSSARATPTDGSAWRQFRPRGERGNDTARAGGPARQRPAALEGSGRSTRVTIGEVALALAAMGFAGGDDAARARSLRGAGGGVPFGAAPPVRQAGAGVDDVRAQARRRPTGSSARSPTCGPGDAARHRRRPARGARARSSATSPGPAPGTPSDLQGRLKAGGGSNSARPSARGSASGSRRDRELRALDAKVERFAPLVGAVLARVGGFCAGQRPPAARRGRRCWSRRGVFPLRGLGGEGADYRLMMGQVERPAPGARRRVKHSSSRCSARRERRPAPRRRQRTAFARAPRGPA